MMFPRLIAAGLVALLLAPAASAENHDVRMLNRGEDGAMVFEPAFIRAEPGDTVTFLSTDRGHNAENIAGMLPEGVEAFSSALGADFVLTVTEEGLYGIKCTPHFAMGMVALIQVGTPVNLEAVSAVPLRGRAGTRFVPLLEQVRM